MLSKITFAAALVLGASAIETEQYGYSGYSSSPSYGGYGYGNSYGFPWVRRSTIRPRDVKAYNVEPVDSYW